MELILHIAAGAGIGLCIGLTGVGGGSLMTPLLLLLGYPLPTAIGTDLLYATLTKTGGIWVHSRQQTVDWKLVGLLTAGSLPAAMLTIILLSTLNNSDKDYSANLTSMLGFMLIVTAIVILLRQKLQQHMQQNTSDYYWLTQHRSKITIILGALLGVCVTLSSVGAGAFAAAMLMLFYAHLPMVRIIGTDIAHAVPLTLVAGLGHWALGNVDLQLLFGLLLGSLPAVALGSKWAQYAPEQVLRPVLAFVLLALGINFLWIL